MAGVPRRDPLPLCESFEPGVGDGLVPSPALRGLRAGTATALIGDTSTGKSTLAEQFLAQGFAELVTLKFSVRAILDGFLSGAERKDVIFRIGKKLQEPLVVSAPDPQTEVQPQEEPTLPESDRP